MYYENGIFYDICKVKGKDLGETHFVNYTITILFYRYKFVDMKGVHDKFLSEQRCMIWSE